ncbi:MAG: sulfatase-like hydrolase/transferase [Candidatus Sumerlaeaceae bacterium]
MKILYIDVDSLRPDHLGCYGYLRNTSPNVDAIAASATRFTNVYASDVPCLPSRTAMWSGRCGFNTGVVNHGGVAAQPLIEGANRGFRDKFGLTGWIRGLREIGFHTATVSSFGERHSAWHWYAGFNEVMNCGKGGQERADEVASIATEWLDRNAQREHWFLHVNFWDPHTPYNTPASYGNPFESEPLPPFYTEAMRQRCWEGYGPHSAQEPHHYDDNENYAARNPRMPRQIDCTDSMRKWIDGYDTGIRYFDDHLGQLVERLQSHGVWDDTAIIITADHGENLGELNIWGDHQTADQITCNVPLVVRWPGVTDRAAVDETLHYQFDWAATMLELLGGEVPLNWDGRSFAPDFLAQTPSGRDYLVLSQGAWSVQRSVRFDKYLCIWSYHTGFKQVDPIMLFDLKADPHEENNLAGSRPQVVSAAAERLADWTNAQIIRSPHNVDPLRTVLLEGGPYHCRTELPEYLARLRQTGRAHHADFLTQQYPGA